jgi:ATP-dependent helicase Lhr and Lhr-like helicase
MTVSGFDSLHPAVQHHIVNTLQWNGLRPLQDRAAEPIMTNHDVLLLAPTAGGKTEAAAFPLLSRMLLEDWRGLSVLYVCPLRALLNDLHLRLERYCSWVGRSCGIWHGDVGSGDRSRITAEPPDILLTTPESIEAILMARKRDHRALFANLRTVVVDEVHAFAGDDRGWHLQLVLDRIQDMTGRRIQRIGLSATVGNPTFLLDWLAEGSTAPRSVVDGNDASLALTPVDVTVDVTGTLDNTATVIASLHQGEKRLVFCQSRARVEELAVALRARDVTTFVSHSALSVSERRDAELGFRESRNCVIVSTSTLELGIDVGDLDHVILVDPPTTVASFLQRIGRTGRRPGSRRSVVFLLNGQGLELAAALGLLLLWRRGFVEAVQPPPDPLHLIAQQALALILQEGAAGRNELETLLSNRITFGRDREVVHQVIVHLLARSYLFDDTGILGIGEQAEKSLGRRHFIELTSSFTSDPLFSMKHGNKDVGWLDPLSFFKPDGHLAVVILGGRLWQINNIDWNRKVCWVEPSEEPGKSRWLSESVYLSGELCRAVRDVILGEEVAQVRLSKRADIRLAELRAEMPWVQEGSTTLVREGSTVWWTFAGGKANNQLAAAVGAGRSDNFTVVFPNNTTPSEVIEQLKQFDIPPGPSVIVCAALLEGLKFSECLPTELGQRVVEGRARDDSSYRRVEAERISGFHAGEAN